MMDQLPDANARWIVDRVVPESGKSLKPVQLIRRDPSIVIEQLMQDSELMEGASFSPCKLWEDKAKTERVYSDVWTGNWAWRMQVKPITHLRNAFFTDMM